MSKLLIYIILLLVFGFALVTLRRINLERKAFINENISHIKEKEYLIRCINYQSIVINQCNNLIDSNYKLALLFTGESCNICVESLLKLLFNKYGIKEENLMILIDRIEKMDFINSFNDAFRLKLKYKVISDDLIRPINEILLLRVVNGEIANVLEYRPEEQSCFEEYFKQFKYI